MFVAENVYDVAKPVHIWSHLLGLTAFSIKRNKHIFKAHTTFIDSICIIVSTVWGLAICVLFLLSFENVWNASMISISDVYMKSMFLVALSFVIVAMMTNWWTFLSRKHFAITLNLLSDVDEELARLKVPVDLNRQKQIALAFVVFANVLTVVFMLFAHLIVRLQKHRSPKFFLFISLSMTAQQSIFIIFQYTFQMMAVKRRYQKINWFLKHRFWILFSANVDGGNDALNAVASLHDKLVDVSESLNLCYGFPVSKNKFLRISFLTNFHQLMATVANSFGYATLCSYSLIRLFMQTVPAPALVCLNTFFWGALFWVMTYCVAHIGHFTTQEVRVIKI